MKGTIRQTRAESIFRQNIKKKSAGSITKESMTFLRQNHKSFFNGRNKEMSEMTNWQVEQMMTEKVTARIVFRQIPIGFIQADYNNKKCGQNYYWLDKGRIDYPADLFTAEVVTQQIPIPRKIKKRQKSQFYRQS